MKGRYTLGWSKSNGTITIDSKEISKHDTWNEFYEAINLYAKQNNFIYIHTDSGYINFSKGLEHLHCWDNMEEE